MVLRKPSIKITEDGDGNKTPIIQKFERKYEEEDLILDFMINNDEQEDDPDEVLESAAEGNDSEEDIPTIDDTDWINNL